MPRGNNRLDSFENIVATGQVGLLFLIPGFDETLRVNGRATLSLDLADIAACSNERRAPKAGEGGMLGTAALQAKFVRQQIHRVRELTDKPFGANLVLSLGWSRCRGIFWPAGGASRGVRRHWCWASSGAPWPATPA